MMLCLSRPVVFLRLRRKRCGVLTNWRLARHATSKDP